MALALLPFFEWYKPDVPHRMAAIKQLEEAMPDELLSEDAEWFQAWKASGIDQEVYLPRYFRQLDLPGGERKCFTSSGAMAAAYFKKIATQEEYEEIRERYGDTTSVYAHVKALTSLGLQVRFVDNADAEDVMEPSTRASSLWPGGITVVTCCAVNRRCAEVKLADTGLSFTVTAGDTATTRVG